MAKSCIVDSGAIVALLDPREEHHVWAREVLLGQDQPWLTCDAAVSEALFLLHQPHAKALRKLLRQGHLRLGLNLSDHLGEVLNLIEKYNDVPMSLADACLVRMSELAADPLVFTTDADFRIYRRNGRQMIPCLLP